MLDSVEPALLRDPVALRQAAWRLARTELVRRHRYHALQAAVAALRLAVESDAGNLYWGLEASQAFAPDAVRAGRAAAWAAAWRPPLRVLLAILSGLFAAAFIRGLARRDAAILVLSIAVLAKLAIQAVASPLGRLMVPAIALALLVVVLTLADLERGGRVRFLSMGALAGLTLLVAIGPLVRMVVSRDEMPPRVLRFPLAIAGGGGYAECGVESGRLTAIAGDRAWLASGMSAGRVACALPELDAAGILRLDLEGAPVRIEANGRERSRDGASANPATGWSSLVLSEVGAPAPRSVAIEAGHSPVGFGFVRGVPGSPPLPRDRAAP